MAPQSSVDIHVVANKCRNIFATCNGSPFLAQQDWFMRELAIFSLWCANLKATRSDKSSLDHRLGSRSDIREDICDLLHGLATALESCHESIKQETDGTNDVPQRNPSHQHSDSSSELDRVSWDAMSYEASNAPSSANEEAASQPLAESIFFVKTILDQLSGISLAIHKAGNRYRFEEPVVDGSSPTGSFYSLPQVHPSQTDGPATVVDDQILLHESALRALPPTEEPVVDGSSSSSGSFYSLPRIHPTQTDAATTSGAPEVTLDNIHAALRTAGHRFTDNGIPGPRPRFGKPSFSSPAAEETWQVHSARLINLLNSLEFEIGENLESDIQAKYDDAIHAIEEMKSAAGYFEERQPFPPATVDQVNKPEIHDIPDSSVSKGAGKGKTRGDEAEPAPEFEPHLLLPNYSQDDQFYAQDEELNGDDERTLRQSEQTATLGTDSQPSVVGPFMYGLVEEESGSMGLPRLKSGIAQPRSFVITQDNDFVFDFRYKKQHSKKYQPGAVFKTLWAEPRGQASATDDPVSEVARSLQSNLRNFYIGIRRFIVVATDHGHSSCVPVLTYKRQGCKKSGIRPLQHGIIYQRGSRPYRLKDEPDMGFAPVALDMTVGEKIDKVSRVNYSKIVDIEHNSRVYFIGRLMKDDYQAVQDAVECCWYNKIHGPSN